MFLTRLLLLPTLFLVLVRLLMRFVVEMLVRVVVGMLVPQSSILGLAEPGKI